MNLQLSDLVFQNNGSGQMCHVLGHGNLPKKTTTKLTFYSLTPCLKDSCSIQVYAVTYRAASHLAVSSIRIMIIMNRTIINHGRNKGMFMLKIKQKLTLASNGIGRGSTIYVSCAKSTF